MPEVVDIYPVCPKCGEETYPTMILMTQGRCSNLVCLYRAKVDGDERRMTVQVDDSGFEFPNEESRWVWIAGVVDTEGIISIIKSKSRYRKYAKRCFRWIPRMNCSSTTLILLKQIQYAVRFGAISPSAYKNQNKEREKPVWKWQMESNGLRHVLPKILPYLVVKKRHAEIMLQALRFIKPGAGTNDMEVEKCWRELKELNRRGPI